MFQAIKDIGNFLKAKGKNCSPFCAHCEVEVSETTARAISSLLDRRIKQVSENSALVSELKLQKAAILRGDWHGDYDALTE